MTDLERLARTKADEQWLREQVTAYEALSWEERQGHYLWKDLDGSTCAFCEHFDGGGEAAVRPARAGLAVVQGDCHNSRSPRFITASDDTCSEFVADTSMPQHDTAPHEVSPDSPAKHPADADAMPQRQTPDYL